MDSMGETDTRTEDSDLFTDKLVLDIIKQTVVDIEDLKMSLYMWDAQELHMYGDHEDEFKLGLITKGKAEEYLEMFFNMQLKSTKSFWERKEDVATEHLIPPTTQATSSSPASFFGTQDLPPALSEEEGQDKNVMIPKTRSSSNCSTGSSPASSASYDEHSKNIVIPATSSSKCSTFEVTQCLSPTMTENEETHRLALTSTAGLTEATQHSISPPLVGEDLGVFTHHLTQCFKMLGEQGENNDSKKVMTPESSPNCFIRSQERVFEETCSVCPALLEIKDNHNFSIEETKTCSLFPSSSVKETRSLSPALLKQGEHDEENMMIPATISSPECYTNSEKEIETAFPASTTPMFNPEMEDTCSQAFEETKTCSLFPTASENEETHSYPPAMSDKVGQDKDSKHVMIPDTRSSSKCSGWSELKKKTASPASSLAVFTPKMADRCSQDFEQTDTCSLFPRLSENEKTLSLSSALPDKGKHEECTKKGMSPGRRSSPNYFTRFQVRGKMFSPVSSLPTTKAVSTSEWRDKCHQAFKETRILSPPLSQKEGHKGDSKNIMIPEKSTLSKCSNRSEVSRNTCSPLPTITAALKMEESSSQDFEETVTCKPLPALSENEEAHTLSPGLTHVTRSSSICSSRSQVRGETSSPTSSLSICTAMSTLEPADSYFQVSKETCSLSPSLSEQKGHEGDNKSIPKTRTSSKCSTTSEAWRNTPSPLPTVTALSEKGGDDEDSPNSMIPTSRLCSIGSDMMGETVFPASSSRTALSTPEMLKGSSQAFEGTQKLSPAYSKLEGHEEDRKNVMICETRPPSRSPTKSIMGIKIDSSDSSISSAASLTEATLCSISPAMVNDNLRIYTHRLARCFKMLQKQGDKDRKKLRSPETPSSPNCSRGITPSINPSLPTTTAVTIPKLADICLQAFEETYNLSSALLESKDTHSRSPALSEKGGNDEDSKNISIPETRSSSKCSTRSEVRKKTASHPSSAAEFTPEIADSCTQAFKENETCSLFTALSKNEETLSLTPALSEMHTYDEDGKKAISPVTQSSHCSPKSQLRGKTSSPASSLQTTTAVSTPELADSCFQAFKETCSLSQHLSEREESDGDNIMIPETSTSSKCSTKTEVNTKSAFLASTSPTSTAVFTTKTADSCFQAFEETQNCSLFLTISENNKTYSHSPALSEKGRLDEDSSTIMISRSSSKCSTRSDVREKKVFPASSSLTELFTPEMAKSCSQTFEETGSLSSVMAENGGTLRLSPALSELEGHEDNRKTVMVPDTSSSSSTQSEISIKNDSSDSSLSSTAELTEATLRNISPAMVDEDLRRYTHRLALCFKKLQKRDKNSKNVSSPETRSSPTCSNRARVWGKTALPNSSLPTSAKAPTPELADSFLQAFEETCNLFPALLRIKETHSLAPALLEKGEHKRDSKNITIPSTRTSSKHCSEVSRNTPSPLPTVIAVSDMEDSCSQASCFSPAKSATSSSTTSSAMSNSKTVHSCSQAFEETSSLSPDTLEREGHGKDSKGTDPSPSGFGNRKIVSSSTLPTTAALSEIALQGMSPGAVDEDLRWFTHRLAHYFIMLEKEEYGDKKSVIFEVPQQQPESGKQQKSAWRKFFHARRNNKIHPLSHEDLKEDSTATSAQSSAREDPCQSTDDTAELQTKKKKSVWGKFFHTRQNEVQPLSQEDQKAESVTPSTPTSDKKEPCQPKDEILELQKKEKQKKPLWRKFVPARRNGTEQDPSSSHEGQREDPCSPSAPPLTTVDPCQPKNETHEQQKKEIKWKSVWWNFFCPRKKNKIHPFPQDDPS